MQEIEYIDGIVYTSQLVQIDPENVTVEQNTAISEDDQKLTQLLKEFDLEDVGSYLKAAQITYRSLKYLRADDIKEAIPPCGLRAEFREKLFIWREKKYGIDDATLSLSSKVTECLNNSSCFSHINCLSSPNVQKLKNLENLLQETSKGKSLLEFYKQNHEFGNANRDELINIIVEEVVFNNITLSSSDFRNLVEEIISLFPTEADSKEYYYIPRNGKKNPSGKLYGKYVNYRAKKRKSSGTSTTAAATPPSSSREALQEVDLSIATALKTSLCRSNSNWDEVRDNWEKTYQLRQTDLAVMNNIEFLNAWPKYSDARAPELIKIDFNLMYPGKDVLMYTKWDLFRNKITSFYESNLHNEFCKELSSIAKASENNDSQDYILTMLLNAVLPPITRFKNKSGRCNKKATIADSQESFVLRVVSINDYERKINELILKYYSVGLTIQPFLVVEGVSDAEIISFYIYFDKRLYKFDSFLDSLDTCFKIFQTFSLKYPTACETTWVFVQQYFFNIKTKFDCKSAKLTALLNFMKTK